ncbi:MAG: hypothetical protein NEHIOOID_01293 [Holosporales bacterium]
MIIRSFILTLVTCTGTYILVKSDIQHFAKVDLQIVLKECAITLSEKNLKKDQLDFEMMNIQKNVTKKMKDLAKERNVILLTVPVFGDIEDLTDDILKKMRQEK